jgi:hypothetical protein
MREGGGNITGHECLLLKLSVTTPFYSLFVFLSAVASSRELSNMVERKGFGRAGCRVVVLVKYEPTRDEKKTLMARDLIVPQMKSTMLSLPARKFYFSEALTGRTFCQLVIQLRIGAREKSVQRRLAIQL